MNNLNTNYQTEYNICAHVHVTVGIIMKTALQCFAAKFSDQLLCIIDCLWNLVMNMSMYYTFSATSVKQSVSK